MFASAINGHIFYLVCTSNKERTDLINFLRKHEILAVFHYISLHSSPVFKSKHDGRKLENADKFTNRLVRLPIYVDLSNEEQAFIISKILEFYA